MIICFSGTGNSRFVAEQLATLLADPNVVHLKGELLYDPLKSQLATTDRRIIWVFPTYSWGVPPVVSRFIAEATIAEASEAAHHLVTTCGDDTGLTATQWRHEITHRKWHPVSAHTVIMPNTYVLMRGFDTDSPELASKKLAQAPARIAQIADIINSHTPHDTLTKGSFPAIKSHVIRPYFVHFCMSAKPFRSNAKCIGCGKCASNCPMENIHIENSRPHWHDRCAMCLRCYHICPHKAVDYGNSTKYKGQYILK